MNKINLLKISWLMTHRNGHLYPCVVLDQNKIKFILNDEVLVRKKQKENKTSFWDDSNWNSIFMKRFNDENSAIFFLTTGELIYRCTYFSFDSDNKIVSECTKIFVELIDKYNSEQQISKIFSSKMVDYLSNIYLTKDELRELINEFEKIHKKYIKFEEDSFKGIDFTDIIEKKKMFLKINNIR